jgi:hypothetical protein
MAATIWRYRLPLAEAPHISMPAGAEVLSVAVGRGGGQFIEVWARVDPSATTEPRAFRVVGTGHPMPDDTGRFLGSLQFDQGRFVFHVFEAR